MPTLPEIHSQIRRLNGFEAFLGRKEIKELPNILWFDESILDIIEGFYNNGTGILVSTNKRLIFVDKGLIFGLTVEDFGYDKITSIQYETGIFLGKLTIFASGNKAVIDNVAKSSVRVFGDGVRARIAAFKQSEVTQSTVVTSQPKLEASGSVNFIDQLERLAKLKEQGILTHEEFITQKMKILDQNQ